MRRTQDLWNIGRAVGIHGFREDKEIDAELALMAAEIARAKRDDRRLVPRAEGQVREALQRVIKGEQHEQYEVDVNFRNANARWMEVLRAKFAGAVIRRGPNSKDNNGNLISGLTPYVENVCMLELYRHEYAALDQLAENALSKKSVARRFSSEVSKHGCANYITR